MRPISYAARTHQGPARNLNEDDYEVDLINQLYFILDGYGGQGIGDSAVRMVKDHLKTFYTRIGPDPEATMPFYYSPKYLLEGNALINALRFSHKMLYEQNKKKDLQMKAGASCLALAMSEHIMSFVSTGNCVCYLYRLGEMRRFMTEDSIYYFTPDSYQAHLKTAPLSGLGLFEDLHLQVKELHIMEGDTLLLLSDGVYARYSLTELQYHIENRDISDVEMIDRLFEVSNNRGNMDNQTALILRF